MFYILFNDFYYIIFKEKKMETLVTHDGIFHADEVFAIALWKKYISSDIEIIRTRDDIDADISIDVGGLYFPKALKFDHHQRDYQGDLSSVGMVAKYIQGQDIKIPGKVLDLVKILDDNDTGKKRSDLRIVKTIRELNSPEPFSSAQKWNFDMALSYARLVLLDLEEDATFDEIGYAVLVGDKSSRNPIKEAIYKNKERAKELDKEINKTIKKYPIDNGIITFESKEVFIPAVKLIGIADISIQYDGNQACWSVQCIPLEEGSFETKYTLKPVNSDNEVFIHKAGFIGKYKADQNGTIVININGTLREIYVGGTEWKL